MQGWPIFPILINYENMYPLAKTFDNEFTISVKRQYSAKCWTRPFSLWSTPCFGGCHFKRDTSNMIFWRAFFRLPVPIESVSCFQYRHIFQICSLFPPTVLLFSIISKAKFSEYNNLIRTHIMFQCVQYLFVNVKILIVTLLPCFACTFPFFCPWQHVDDLLQSQSHSITAMSFDITAIVQSGSCT